MPFALTLTRFAVLRCVLILGTGSPDGSYRFRRARLVDLAGLIAFGDLVSTGLVIVVIIGMILGGLGFVVRRIRLQVDESRRTERGGSRRHGEKNVLAFLFGLG